MSRACYFCRATPAPFGFTIPGRRSKVPAEKRDKYLWTCAGCRSKGEDKLRAVSNPSKRALKAAMDWQRP